MSGRSLEAAGAHVLQFLPKDIGPRWPAIYGSIRDAIAQGTKNPPLAIIAVPANVNDVKAYLAEKLAA